MSDILGQLRRANPGLGLLPISDPAFGRYGRVLSQLDPAEVTARAEAILPTAEGVVYEASVAALEKPCTFNRAVAEQVFGGMPVQVGWCYGRNLRMAGLEYHKGSEVVVCLTDTLLLLGHVQEIVYGATISYDTRQVKAFFASAGSVVELAPWNLHFAPIHVRAGGQFATLVYLPRGTNGPLTFEVPRRDESALLFGINKWLMVHPGASALVAQGAYAGMVGDDIVVRPIG